MLHARTLALSILIALLAGPAHARTASVEFQDIVDTLAAPEMEGRDAGTQGLERARDYVMQRFVESGLQPAFGVGEKRGWLQPFDVNLGVEATRQTLAIGGDGSLQGGAGGDFNAMGFSADGTFEGTPVFLGYGLKSDEHGYDSYAGLDEGSLRGKVAVIFRYEPHDEEGRSLWTKSGGGRWSEAAGIQAKAEHAAVRGAAAVLLVDPPSLASNALRSTAGTSLSEERLAVPVMHVGLATFERMLTAAGRDAGKAVQTYERRANEKPSAPDELAGVVVRGEVALERRSATVHNVGAYLPGAGELADELVVVGAHYDHLGQGSYGSLARDNDGSVHPGADDNASGTAALVLLAERLKAWSDANPQAPRRGLLFVAFAGEERGLLGSMHMVRSPDTLPLPLASVAAMVNFDMVGRMRDDKLFLFSTESSKDWRPLLDAANEGVGLKLGYSSFDGMGSSDHASFTTARIPAVHFFTGVHEDYHRPSDVAARINADGGAKVIDYAERAVRELATRRERLAFDESTASPHGPGPGLAGSGAYLGVMPDYNRMEDAGGAAIAGVSPNAPAEKAGLRAGDVLQAWNGRPIANLRDLMRFLSTAQPGEKVTLTVRRGTEDVRVEAELGRR